MTTNPTLSSKLTARTALTRRASFAITLAGAFLCPLIAFSQGAAKSPYTPYVERAKQQMEQARIQVEEYRLMQAEFRARGDVAAAKRQDETIKRLQNTATLKQQEMSMYQQQESLENQPLSKNAGVAAAQQQMRKWTFEKAQLGLRQTVANQANNKPEAARLAAQINTLQLRITAQQQAIRLLEMKERAGQ